MVAYSYSVAIQYVYLGWEKTNPNLLSLQIHINSDWIRVASRNAGCFLSLTLSHIFKLCKQAITSAPLTQILVKSGLNGLKAATPLHCVISNYWMTLSMIWKNYALRSSKGGCYADADSLDHTKATSDLFNHFHQSIERISAMTTARLVTVSPRWPYQLTAKSTSRVQGSFEKGYLVTLLS